MFEPCTWQAVLDHHASLFVGLEPGTAAVLLPQATWVGQAGESLLWRRDPDGMRASLVLWEGVEACDAELIFVAMRDALARLAAVPVESRLGLFRDQVREGDVLFFVTRNCDDLDVGWEAFLESLNPAFMGACR
jgi:hypothetical protein